MSDVRCSRRGILLAGVIAVGTGLGLHPSASIAGTDLRGAAINPNLLRAAQQALKAQGFDPGPVDGRSGSRTTRALTKFQQARNLNVTGSLDYPTRQALGLSQ